jgi:triacylglycerol lipase
MNAPKLQRPIVLVHGILGFNELFEDALNETHLRRVRDALGIDRIVDFEKLRGLLDEPRVEYFRGIREVLADVATVVAPTLSPTGSIALRGGQLAEFLKDRADLGQVHIVAHSMGGLDSRYMISRLGMASRVLSLTTLGTPHQGSPIADVATRTPGSRLVDFIRGIVGGSSSHLGGLFDLTTDACKRFNVETPDHPSVQYFSIAGVYTPASLDLLRPSHQLIVERGRGPNDGLVPVSSARYPVAPTTNGSFLGTWEANHFRLINWGTNIVLPAQDLLDDSIAKQYLALAEDLAHFEKFRRNGR